MKHTCRAVLHSHWCSHPWENCYLAHHPLECNLEALYHCPLQCCPPLSITVLIPCWPLSITHSSHSMLPSLFYHSTFHADHSLYHSPISCISCCIMLSSVHPLPCWQPPHSLSGSCQLMWLMSQIDNVSMSTPVQIIYHWHHNHHCCSSMLMNQTRKEGLNLPLMLVLLVESTTPQHQL